MFCQCRQRVHGGVKSVGCVMLGLCGEFPPGSGVCLRIKMCLLYSGFMRRIRDVCFKFFLDHWCLITVLNERGMRENK